MFQIFPEVNVAVDKAWEFFQQLFECLAIVLRCIHVLNQVCLHSRLEEKRIWSVNLFELVDASKILSDHVLVGKSLLSFSFAALLGLNHFVSFLSTMTEVGEVSRV